MARELTFAFPGDLNTLTGGYIYDKRIIEGLRALGWVVETLSLDASFPWPSASVRQSTQRCLANVESARRLVIDGLALGALGAEAQALAAAHPFVALVHHPLALESGLSEEQARGLFESEREALRWAQMVIVTSPVTASTLEHQFDVPANKQLVVLPGIDRPLIPNRCRQSHEPLRLLSVGAIVPRKAFDVLIRALGTLKQDAWRLTIVGDDTRSPETTQALRALIEQLDLTGRVEIRGAVASTELAMHYADADAFVLASRYEGYGMAFAEALAWGLPVVGTQGGAISSTVPPGASLLVEPDNSVALACALQTLVSDADCRARMAAAARSHAKSLPDWQDAAQAFAAALSADRTQSADPGPRHRV